MLCEDVGVLILASMKSGGKVRPAPTLWRRMACLRLSMKQHALARALWRNSSLQYLQTQVSAAVCVAGEGALQVWVVGAVPQCEAAWCFCWVAWPQYSQHRFCGCPWPACWVMQLDSV